MEYSNRQSKDPTDTSSTSQGNQSLLDFPTFENPFRKKAFYDTITSEARVVASVDLDNIFGAGLNEDTPVSNSACNVFPLMAVDRDALDTGFGGTKEKNIEAPDMRKDEFQDNPYSELYDKPEDGPKEQKQIPFALFISEAYPLSPAVESASFMPERKDMSPPMHRVSPPSPVKLEVDEKIASEATADASAASTPMFHLSQHPHSSSLIFDPGDLFKENDILDSVFNNTPEAFESLVPEKPLIGVHPSSEDVETDQIGTETISFAGEETLREVVSVSLTPEDFACNEYSTTKNKEVYLLGLDKSKAAVGVEPGVVVSVDSGAFSSTESTVWKNKVGRYGSVIHFGFGGIFVSCNSNASSPPHCFLYSLSSVLEAAEGEEEALHITDSHMYKTTAQCFRSLREAPGPLGAHGEQTVFALKEFLLASTQQAAQISLTATISPEKYPLEFGGLWYFLYVCLNSLKVNEASLYSGIWPIKALFMQKCALWQSSLTNSQHAEEDVIRDEICRLLCVGEAENAIQLAIQHKAWNEALLLAYYLLPDYQKKVVSDSCEDIFVWKKGRHRAFTDSYEKKQPNSLAEAKIWILASHILFLLLSGTPVVATEDILKDWFTYVAVCSTYISVENYYFSEFLRSIGAALEERKETHGAHICYLLCGDHLSRHLFLKGQIILLGLSNHQFLSLSIPAFIEAFQLSEILEFFRRGMDSQWLYPTLTPFKITYALLLAEFDLLEKAERYLRTSELFLRTQPSSYYSENLRSLLRDALQRVSEAINSKRRITAKHMDDSHSAFDASTSAATSSRKQSKDPRFDDLFDTLETRSQSSREAFNIGWLSDVFGGLKRVL